MPAYSKIQSTVTMHSQLLDYTVAALNFHCLLPMEYVRMPIKNGLPDSISHIAAGCVLRMNTLAHESEVPSWVSHMDMMAHGHMTRHWHRVSHMDTLAQGITHGHDGSWAHDATLAQGVTHGHDGTLAHDATQQRGLLPTKTILGGRRRAITRNSVCLPDRPIPQTFNAGLLLVTEAVHAQGILGKVSCLLGCSKEEE
eukprot:174082-Pelagomonas_calceolata.AAC.1